MKEFWNKRYSSEQYAYGELPNEYFRETISGLDPGKILLPAEGEGRNAVFAASIGWDVSAFDISEAGKEKAEQLAEKHGVGINYLMGDVESLAFEAESFDAIGLVFAHFPGMIRQKIHHRLSTYLKHGGHLIMEAFSKKHLAYNMINEKAGGPKDEDMLYTVEDIRSDFPGYHILELIETDTSLHEGEYHQGKASVIRFFGKKL
jgi:2-polyprenyl-3-methyl-5-hydroxy-6-metoxy-1,4-benzoquinol methylase